MVYALLKVKVGRVAQKGRGVEHFHLHLEILIDLSSNPHTPNCGAGLSDIEEERNGKGILLTYLGGFLTLVPTHYHPLRSVL